MTEPVRRGKTNHDKSMCSEISLVFPTICWGIMRVPVLFFAKATRWLCSFGCAAHGHELRCPDGCTVGRPNYSRRVVRDSCASVVAIVADSIGQRPMAPMAPMTAQLSEFWPRFSQMTVGNLFSRSCLFECS